MVSENRLKSLLKIQYPIIQGAMLGVTTTEMVAAVCQSGCLGSLPVGGLSPEKTIELIKGVKSKTQKCFAVNLFAHDLIEETDDDVFERMQDFLEKFQRENGIPFERMERSHMKFHHYSEQVPFLIEENIPVVSFTFGVLDADSISKLKNNGTILIGTATSVKEAVVLENAGVDIVTAQGIEAGGHRGTFIDTSGLPQIGLNSLVSQMVKAVNIPVVAAGGICNENTANAALALGAEGLQLGSIFIPGDESEACDAYKAAVLSAIDTDTSLTRAFTGRWARGIRNRFMDELEASGLQIPYYTYQNQLTAAIRAHGKKNNDKDLVSMWAGQSAGQGRRGKTADILERFISSVYPPSQPPFAGDILPLAVD